MKKILITGSNGMLASRIISIMREKDYFIIGCDINKSDNNLDYFQLCNLSSEEDIKLFISKLNTKNLFPDILINNAAIDFVPFDNEQSDGLDFNDFNKNVNIEITIFISDA